MKRRAFMVAVLGAASFPARVASAESVRRVGVLGATGKGDTVRILRERLSSAGFVEGRNLEIHVEDAELDRAGEGAGRIVDARPEIVYAISESSVDALKARTSAIPIVFLSVTEPVQRGYVREFARPGGNITGVTDRYVETGVKRLELLREVAPRAKCVAFASDFADQVGHDAWRSAAARLGFKVVDANFANARLDAALEHSRAAGADCLFPIGALWAHEKDGNAIFVRFAERNRLPAVFASTGMVTRFGGLMSLDIDQAAARRQGADMVVRVLRGEKTETMAVQEPDRFAIAVNLRTAKKIGMTIPRSVLLRAEEVVE